MSHEVVTFPDDLVADLREAYAKYGRLETRPQGHCVILTRPCDQAPLDSICICEIELPPWPSDQKQLTFLFLAWEDWGGTPSAQVPIGQWDPERHDSPSRKTANYFLDLADRLGAHLPRRIRYALVSAEKMHETPPRALWCLLLYREFAVRQGVFPRPAESTKTTSEIVEPCTPWLAPFCNSLDLVERLQLAASFKDTMGIDQDSLEMAPSPDFASVSWGVRKFSFNSRQAACVCLLWDTLGEKTNLLSQNFILANAADRFYEQTGIERKESSSNLETLETAVDYLKDVFKKHPAWKTMIVGDGKGNFGLQRPSESDMARKNPT